MRVDWGKLPEGAATLRRLLEREDTEHVLAVLKSEYEIRVERGEPHCLRALAAVQPVSGLKRVIRSCVIPEVVRPW